MIINITVYSFGKCALNEVLWEDRFLTNITKCNHLYNFLLHQYHNTYSDNLNYDHLRIIKMQNLLCQIYKKNSKMKQSSAENQKS